MFHRLVAVLSAALMLTVFATAAHAGDKLKAVASFSILGDMVKNVGGDRVELVMLVGPDSDAHMFSPTPGDARKLANAQIFFVNGLGFEGWMERLEKSSGFKGRTVVASKGITPLKMEDAHEDHAEGAHDHDEGHGDHTADKAHDHDAGHDGHAEAAHDHDGGHDGHAAEKGHDHDAHADAHDHDAHADVHDHGDIDPHAWQSLANGAIYVANIRDGLIAADPAGKAVYQANAEQYLAALKQEDDAVRAAISGLPESRRRIITSHEAFDYFADSYGIEVIAPEGVSTESEASAQDVAKIIRQIRADKIPAVFIENVSDPRLLEQIAKETGAKIGGTLYSDALSAPEGPAPTYIDMFKHNVGTLTSALSS